MGKIDIESLAENLSWGKFCPILGNLILEKYRKDLFFIYLKIRLKTNALFPGHNKRMVDIEFLALQTAVALFAMLSISNDKDLVFKITEGVIAYIQGNTFLRKNSIYAEAYRNRVYDLMSDSRLAENFCRYYGIEMSQDRKILMKLVMYLSVSKSAYAQLFRQWKITH